MVKFRHLEIRTKLILLIIAAGIFCILLFCLAWTNRWNVWQLLSDSEKIHLLLKPDKDFIEKLENEAIKYDIPDSENDTERINVMKPFFDIVDKYTAIYIYGNDGRFLAKKFPEKLENSRFYSFLRIGYELADDAGEHTISLRFRNGRCRVIIKYYHSSLFFVQYLAVCLIVCIFLFFFMILSFTNRKLRSVIRLKQYILQMSTGDLDTPVPEMDHDEIGILARELDMLRTTLRDNIISEQQMHKANWELVTALSHDMRTPLTILKGYLEILRLNRNPQMQADYIERCFQKTEDIGKMMDQIFDYALVYDEAGYVNEKEDEMIHTEIPILFLIDTLNEHIDFLSLIGFKIETHYPLDLSDPTQAFAGSKMMVKRVLSNLFSNAIKYADKKATVALSLSLSDTLTVLMENSVKHECGITESTQIGLRSSRMMMEKMGGGLNMQIADGRFLAEVTFKIAAR